MSIKEIFRNWFFKDCSVMTGDGKNFEASEYMSTIWEQPGFMLPIKKKIKACQNIEMGIYIGKEDGKKKVDNHILNKIFRMINPNTSFQDFIDYLIVWLEGSNNGVLLELIKGLPSLAPDLYIHSPSNFTVYFEGRRIRKIRIHIILLSIKRKHVK